METLPESPQAVLELFSTSKESIERFCNPIIEDIKEGRVDALKVKALCKTLEVIAERIDKATKDEQKNEASKYGEKPFMFNGCEMHLTPVKTDYEYKNCNDTEWESMDSELRNLKERIRTREEFLKHLTKSEQVLDSFSGELVTINPPTKKQIFGVKVSIK